MKMTTLQSLKDKGSRLGECGLLAKVSNGVELMDLLFDARGREFCRRYAFPALDDIRTLANILDTRALLDCTDAEIDNPTDVALIGHTEATIRISKPSTLHHIVLMHGASLRLELSHYAVVTLTIIGQGCRWSVCSDGTAMLNIEEETGA